MILKGSDPNNFYSNNQSNIIAGQSYTADKSNPFWKTIGDNVVYRNWSWECVPSGKLIIIGSIYDNIGLLYPPLGTTPGIYGALSIKLEIYTRWGQLFRELYFEDCATLSQGDVFWDGTYANGTYVQDGVYVFKLLVKTCSNSEYQPYCNSDQYTYLQPGSCLEYCFGKIPGEKWWAWGWYCCQTYNGSDCAYKVTVLK